MAGRIHRTLAAAALALIAAIPGLSSCGPSEFPIEDVEGHECVRICESEESQGCTVECDDPPILPPGESCSPDPRHACYKLGFDNGIWGLCVACCNGDEHIWDLRFCTPLVCEDQEDCASADVQCIDGRCR